MCWKSIIDLVGGSTLPGMCYSHRNAFAICRLAFSLKVISEV